MKHTFLLAVTFLTMACGGANGDDAGEPMASEEDISVCSCINHILGSPARTKACTELLGSLPEDELAGKAVSCRQNLEVPEGGPDLCYCIKALSADPEVGEACKEIVGENRTPREISQLAVECAKK